MGGAPFQHRRTRHVAQSKRAVLRASPADRYVTFIVRNEANGTIAAQGVPDRVGPVDQWRDWHFWTLAFDELRAEGSYVIECQPEDRSLGVVRSHPFRVQASLLERHTLSDVLFYFKSQRCSGALDKADRALAFQSRPGTHDVHGGWYDASGDYGKHLSHLSYSTYHNPQQAPLVVYSLFKSLHLLDARRDDNFTQYRRRLLDEALFGADFLVRMRNPEGSFFRSVAGRGPGKKPEDRRITPAQGKGFVIKMKKPVEGTSDALASSHEAPTELYDVGYRSGGGMAIAGLALAAKAAPEGEYSPADYLQAAEDTFAWLEAHNLTTANDGRENILDDVCALLAATELMRATGKANYAVAAAKRADSLLNRLVPYGEHGAYWRADDGDRPFFHASDAGLPVIALMGYHGLAEPESRDRIVQAVRRSLAFEVGLTGQPPNPFGLARQYTQSKSGERRVAFFYPHDSDSAPWWQGENARLASLAAAARLAAPLFASDDRFARDLRAYATNQLNWILGLNPFDACMLQGTGRNNPEYYFFGSYQYRNAPGGICNGITAGFKNPRDIDFNLTHTETGGDHDWRWGEQWLPHAAWYLLAVAVSP